ncbi:MULTISPECIES: clan AA aspartic protease [unclassified Chamaesiphon]|uniref:clan AA aspartic protease n=1 Tax=unclassified Chamaesiphon TaxID=2620921 RepID=UPI002869FDCD|nr:MULTISPECIES: clan AA aspartic protease [unclassified Chamaesiphon]
MMFGRVNQQREAILKLIIIGDGNSKIAVDAVIDTGFNGDLILPIEIVSELGLVPQGYQKATLGDGSISQFRVYVATVIWDGERKLVEVNSATAGILIGMGLLEGYKLEVNATPNGDVSIIKLDEI